MWKTKLTELLGIDYPIIQGAMAYLSESALVSSVCAAGATGVIATGGWDVDYVRDEIRKTKDAIGKKPFGVNLMLQAPNKDDIAQLVIDEKVAFVTIGAGNPVPYLEPLQSHGIRCIPVVPSVKLAKRVEDKGADAIVIEGMEAGGHDGKLTLMALMENVIPEMEIPVIAAGGIADGRGIAAALMMGASGVQIGSRFLVSEECVLHPASKAAVLAASDTDSTVTGFTRADSVRGIKSKWSEAFLAREYAGAPDEELAALARGSYYNGAVKGDTENGYILVGMSLNRLTKIQPAAEIVEELVSETEKSLALGTSLIR